MEVKTATGKVSPRIALASLTTVASRVQVSTFHGKHYALRGTAFRPYAF